METVSCRVIAPISFSRFSSSCTCVTCIALPQNAHSSDPSNLHITLFRRKVNEVGIPQRGRYSARSLDDYLFQIVSRSTRQTKILHCRMPWINTRTSPRAGNLRSCLRLYMNCQASLPGYHSSSLGGSRTSPSTCTCPKPHLGLGRGKALLSRSSSFRKRISLC